MDYKELERLLNGQNKAKRRMKTGKKALCSAFVICAVLVTFTMAMIYLEKDTSSLGILAAAGVGILPFIYNIYTKANTQINLKHMEENYVENYDEKEGLY